MSEEFKECWDSGSHDNYRTEIEKLRAQLAAANEAKEKAEMERDEAKLELRNWKQCEYESQVNVLESALKAEQMKKACDPHYCHAAKEVYRVALEAAEQKTAELAAIVAEKDNAIGMAQGLIEDMLLSCSTGNCFKGNSISSVMEILRKALALTTPAAQVLAERDAGIWREAAKIAREHFKDHEKRGDSMEKTPDDDWVSKAAKSEVVATHAHIAMECEYIAAEFEAKAAALSSKSAIGPEEGEGK